jgi:hypothetical protein
MIITAAAPAIAVGWLVGLRNILYLRISEGELALVICWLPFFQTPII